MANPRVIISLTSFPARFSSVEYVIRPLLHQTVAPDAIELWLARDEVASVDDVPASLRALEREGLSIRWCPCSLKPHNKYFWAMREHPDDIIITVDDDIIYPLTMVQGLMQEHYLHPDAIISNRTHIVTCDETGAIKPYREWIFEQRELLRHPRHDLLATGVGSVLYPPSIFGEEVLDEEAIRTTSLMADDLWLLVHEQRLGIPVVSTGINESLSYVPGTQEAGGLFIDNVDGGRNDRLLAALFERYPEAEAALRAAVAEREAKQNAATNGEGAAEAVNEGEGGRASFPRRVARRLLRR